MNTLKFVIDSNALVSSFSTPGHANEPWRAGSDSHELFISPEIFAETERTLRQAELRLSPEEIRRCLKDILSHCRLVRPAAQYKGPVSDEQDRRLASLALEIKADKIIVGDNPPRADKEIAGIPVLGQRALAISQPPRVASGMTPGPAQSPRL